MSYHTLMVNSQKQLPAEKCPRAPSSEELAQLWDWMQKSGTREMYSLHEDSWLEQFWIAVFDHYITGCPGYAGKLMYLVWDGTPDSCTVFIWHKKKLVAYSAQAAGCGSNFDEEEAPQRKLEG